jgi:hypothetical protein
MNSQKRQPRNGNKQAGGAVLHMLRVPDQRGELHISVAVRRDQAYVLVLSRRRRRKQNEKQYTSYIHRFSPLSFMHVTMLPELLPKPSPTHVLEQASQAVSAQKVSFLERDWPRC